MEIIFFERKVLFIISKENRRKEKKRRTTIRAERDEGRIGEAYKSFHFFF